MERTYRENAGALRPHQTALSPPWPVPPPSRRPPAAAASPKVRRRAACRAGLGTSQALTTRPIVPLGGVARIQKMTGLHEIPLVLISVPPPIHRNDSVVADLRSCRIWTARCARVVVTGQVVVVGC